MPGTTAGERRLWRMRELPVNGVAAVAGDSGNGRAEFLAPGQPSRAPVYKLLNKRASPVVCTVASDVDR